MGDGPADSPLKQLASGLRPDLHVTRDLLRAIGASTNSDETAAAIVVAVMRLEAELHESRGTTASATSSGRRRASPA